jgi:hypothetical protein
MAITQIECFIWTLPDCEVRVLSTTSRSVGWAWRGAVTNVTRGRRLLLLFCVGGIDASSEANNCLP